MTNASTTHPRTIARRQLLFPFRLIVIQGRICKVLIDRSTEGAPTMRLPATATIRDLLDLAEVQGERPRDLLDRLRGADRQWRLDHREAINLPGKN